MKQKWDAIISRRGCQSLLFGISKEMEEEEEEEGEKEEEVKY